MKEDSVTDIQDAIRAITIWQPWATLLATGEKRFETRPWATRYTGPIAIHAGRDFRKEVQMIAERSGFCDLLERHGFAPDKYPRGELAGLPLGAIVGVGWMKRCVKTEDIVEEMFARSEEGSMLERDQIEVRLGDFHRGRFGFEIVNVTLLAEPIVCAGAQRLWRLDCRFEAAMRGMIDVDALGGVE